MARGITVVGSANLDIVVPVPHHPTRGETVLGGDHSQIPGGKGANQAVAAARLGADVTFVGCVGDDTAGITLRQSLDDSGVDTSRLNVATGVPSGIALIAVGPDGDNTIVVSPGANARLSPDDITRHTSSLHDTVTLLQLEIPLETTIRAATTATGVVILDPAPAPADGLPGELFAAIDILAPNETELALLAKRPIDQSNLDDVIDAARSLAVETVVVTLGSRGALVVGEVTAHIPAPAVEAIDTTAAGDAFRAALATQVARDRNIVDSASFAARVGAATTLRFGAQPSLPAADELDDLLS